MASSRLTGTNENISTYDSAGGRDYSVLSVWESATDNDLVTAEVSEVLECYKGEHLDSIELSGGTTSADYFRIIRPASGQGHSGIPKLDGSCVAFTKTSGLYHFQSDEAHSSVQDIVLTFAGSSASDLICVYSHGDFCSWVGVLVVDATNSIGSIHAFYTSSAVTTNIINCLAHNIKASALRLSGGTCNLYNFTQVDAAHGMYNVSSVVNAKNCLFKNQVYNYGTLNETTNIRGVATFVDADADDFTLSLADTTAKNTGTDLSGDANFPFTDDILGNTRGTAWDVGFFEIVTSAISVYDSISTTESVDAKTDCNPAVYSSAVIADYTTFEPLQLNIETVTTVALSEYSLVNVVLTKAISRYQDIRVVEAVNVFISGYLVNGKLEVFAEPLSIIIEPEAV